MGKADIIVDIYFLQYGKRAPMNSNFDKSLDMESLFGSVGWNSYTSRENATERSIEKYVPLGSFSEYTSRNNAIDNSSNTSYFTMTNEGKVFDQQKRDEWIEHSKWAFSKKGDIAWEITVSLESYKKLEELQLKDQEDMAKITSIALTKTFKRLGMNPDNMIWWEDYHTNTKHPHMHITFLEKENTRARGKLTRKELKEVKRIFINEIGARKKFLAENGINYQDVLKEAEMTKRRIVSDINELDYSSFSDIINLYTQLPKYGRLQYNSSNMIPFREQLDDIVDRLLKKESISEEYRSFIDKLDQLADVMDAMGNEKISTIKESEDKKLRIQIANSILNEFKHLDGKTLAHIRKISEWKNNACLNDLKELSFEKLEHAIQDPILKEAYQALFEGNIEKGMEILKPLEETSDGLFIKAALHYLNGESDIGIALMYAAAEKGHKEAKKYVSLSRKKIGNNLRHYKALRKKLGSTLVASVNRDINEQKNELERELTAFLHNRKDAVAQEWSYETDEYLRG